MGALVADGVELPVEELSLVEEGSNVVLRVVLLCLVVVELVYFLEVIVELDGAVILGLCALAVLVGCSFLCEVDTGIDDDADAEGLLLVFESIFRSGV